MAHDQGSCGRFRAVADSCMASIGCSACPRVASVSQHLLGHLQRNGAARSCRLRAVAYACCATETGQIYLPEVNYVMMILTVIVVAIFRTTTVLGNAYGEMNI